MVSKETLGDKLKDVLDEAAWENHACTFREFLKRADLKDKLEFIFDSLGLNEVMDSLKVSGLGEEVVPSPIGQVLGFLGQEGGDNPTIKGN